MPRPRRARLPRDAPPESRILDLRRRFDERYAGRDYLAWMSYAALKTKPRRGLPRPPRQDGHAPLRRRPRATARPDPRPLELLDPSADQGPALQQKALLRSVASRFVPAYVLERPKQGFCAPIGAWCAGILEERPIPAASPLVESGLVRRDAFEKLEHSRAAAGFASWTLSLLAEWTERNLIGSNAPHAVAS